MKKIFISLLVVCLLVPLVGTFEVFAQDLKSCGYEVAYINDDGSFSTESCYSDFVSAKNRMKELGGDVVVRHDSSYSYTKIIAMNSGIAYSYPRDGATLNIYQDVNNHSIYYKQTYVARHFELNYLDTERYLGDGRGMIETNINGFHGFTDLEYVDLIPSKYLRNNIPITLGGNNHYKKEDFFTVYPKQNYYERSTNGNYSEVVYHIYRGFPANPNSSYEPISETIVIGPAPSEMAEGVKYYSNDGVTFYTDGEFKNRSFVYYNYYQFLPLRSKTNISADIFNSYISKYDNSVMRGTGQTFIDAQNKYGINALLLFAMAAHESGNGTSNIAVNNKNLFGWNAVDANPSQASKFSSVAECINQQAGINLRGFVDITDGRFFSSSLGNKGSGLNVKYASDPYWGMEIASIAYQIDKLSKNKNGTLSDYNYYSLSLINKFDIPVKQEPSDGSKTLYTTQYGPHYQEGFIVIDLGTQGSYTKVQSTNPIDENGNIKTHRTPITTGNLNPISYGEYDFDRSVAYINSNYLTVINKKNDEAIDVPDKEISLMHMIENMRIENGNLIFSGLAFIKGLSANEVGKITQNINVVNILDNSSKTYKATCKEYEGINFNDSHTYKYVGFEVSIPLNDIKNGSYYLNIEVNNNGNTLSSPITSLESNLSNFNYNSEEYTYHIGVNSYYNYRYEIEVESLPSQIDYSLVNKPFKSIRNSLFSFDTLTLDEKLNFDIDGQSMIYYVDYDNIDTIKRTIYFVDTKDNYKAIDCESYKSSIDYTSILSSSYNLDYISFKANSNLSDLKKGIYAIVMKLENGEFVDYIELNNLSGLELPEINFNGINYRFFTSNIRNRLMLEVK
ncbi:MAG: glucosaminidase domain-containing protein [Solobacterium sp.]|nr:glucosaminidase domain-containing protein [Solobacterium sp.]MCI7157629.1 glucosaminidase domain-containing protein [Solobacterium sp.]MCI7445130.1 glucosaminidase domain-containing protein [Solobacterium sp.]MDY5401696.1 glucosaminidase domain-containing protein [Erysipelotrichaceae bacterium]